MKEVSEIHRLSNTSPQFTASDRQRPVPQPHRSPQQEPHQGHRQDKPKPPVPPCAPNPKPQNHGCARNKKNFLQNLLPGSLYNPETKKILGLLTAEDLLLVALIFLFMDDSNGDNSLLAIALVYVLLSEYIDLGEIGF